jgi:hypothetical protein
MNTKENFDKAITYIKRDGTNELVNWLRNETDFFTAPASTEYHGNYEGGLLYHTLTVLRFALHNFNLIVSENPDLEYLKESVIICALFHDICKVNIYKKEQKWTKDDNGKWKEYFGWKVKDLFPVGHGEKSIYYISKFLKLTEAEIIAIRWHMGHTEPSVVIMNNPHYYAFNQAIDHPLVRLIMCSDMLAISLEEKRDLKNS